MKIVNPSATVIEKELAGLSVCQRIDRCAATCYQRPPKPTEDDAEQFCRHLIEQGHFPALEMAVVHLWMPWEIADHYSIQKFIMVDPVNGDESTRSFSHIRGVSGRYGREGCVTGSIRAFMEADGMTGRWARNTFLFQQYPLFFKDNTKTQVEDRVYSRFATPEEIPWQHKHVAVRVICSRAISLQLVRHRPCSFLQECLSGDTMVRAFSGGNSWSMRQLYKIFNDPRCGRARSAIRVRVMDKDGEIVPSKIISVMRSKEKPLYLVKTRNNRKIKASANHIFFTENGQKRLKELSPGDKTFMNGVDVSRDWLKSEYLDKNRSRAEIAGELGMSDAWLGKVIARWGLQKPKGTFYRGSARPGYGKKGMHGEEGRAAISARMSGGSNHRWVGDRVTESGGRSRLHRRDSARGKTCPCGAEAEHMHHVDRDPRNNLDDNIEFLCVACHKARHSDSVKISWLDEIVSIEPCGIEETYDLEVDRDEHNFAANGFIVHNSQRYCRYDDEVTFIRPEWTEEDASLEVGFVQDCEDIERMYRTRRDPGGLSPQQARGVLSNDTKTELIMYASLPEWLHIFKMRCAKAADPEARRVMLPLREQFQAEYPEMWRGE